MSDKLSRISVGLRRGLSFALAGALAGCCAPSRPVVAPNDGCTDADGDGWGAGCAAGADCDDQNPFYHVGCPSCPAGPAPGCPCVGADVRLCFRADPARIGIGPCRQGTMQCDGRRWGDCAGEVLPTLDLCGDGIDQDCTGTADDSGNACGDCDPNCGATTVGFDAAMPPNYGFDPAEQDHLAPDPARGGLVLNEEMVSAGYVWPANDSTSTVSKIDMDTGEEVGRFNVGLQSIDNSSSRTAVDGRGACYVANRAFSGQGTVSKIAAFDRECIDRNGNGIIDTSRGTTALARDPATGHSTDECVLWTVPVGGFNGVPRALAIDAGGLDHPEGFPWVGLWTDRVFYQLDPATGAVLNTVPVTVSPYGAAVDRDGILWISGRDLNALQSINTMTLAVGPVIPLGSASCSPYGIAIDGAGRVWLGCYPYGTAARYNPADGTWLSVALPNGLSRGIAVDGGGRVWTATHDSWFDGYLVSFRADDGLDVQMINIAGVIPVGVGVDDRGQIWTVNQTSMNVSRVDTIARTEALFPPGGLPSPPYTYSDFTGFQRRTFTAPSGTWNHAFSLCAEPGARWGNVVFDILVPAGTRAEIAARSADTAAGTTAAPPVLLARIPTDSSPVDVGSRFTAAGIPLLGYLHVTVTLFSDSAGTSPVLRSVGVQSYCTVNPG